MREVVRDATYVASAQAAFADADVVLHLTEWAEFRDLDARVVGRLVRNRIMIDGRNKRPAGPSTNRTEDFCAAVVPALT